MKLRAVALVFLLSIAPAPVDAQSGQPQKIDLSKLSDAELDALDKYIKQLQQQREFAKRLAELSARRRMLTAPSTRAPAAVLIVRYKSPNGRFLALSDGTWCKSTDRYTTKRWSKRCSVLFTSDGRLLNQDETDDNIVDVRPLRDLKGFQVADESYISSSDGGIIQLSNGMVFKCSGCYGFGDVAVLWDGLTYKLLSEDDYYDAQRLQ
jgi:hypothetical protein